MFQDGVMCMAYHLCSEDFL